MLHTVGPPAALGLAVALVVLNAKDMVLTLKAAEKLVDADLPTVASLVVIALYAAVASTTVAIPVFAAAVLGDRATPTLHRWRGRLERHGPSVVAVVGLLVALYLIVSAARALL